MKKILAILAVIAVAVITVSADKKADKMLRHVVLFKFKDDATAEQVDKVRKAFLALPSQISQIRDIEWGTNNGPENVDESNSLFFLTFENEKDRDAYLPHPAHKAFGAVLGPYLEKVVVVDYWAKKE